MVCPFPFLSRMIQSKHLFYALMNFHTSVEVCVSFILHTFNVVKYLQQFLQCEISAASFLHPCHLSAFLIYDDQFPHSVILAAHLDSGSSCVKFPMVNRFPVTPSYSIQMSLLVLITFRFFAGQLPLLIFHLGKLFCGFFTRRQGDNTKTFAVCGNWITNEEWLITDRLWKMWCDWSLTVMHIY